MVRSGTGKACAGGGISFFLKAGVFSPALFMYNWVISVFGVGFEGFDGVLHYTLSIWGVVPRLVTGLRIDNIITC